MTDKKATLLLVDDSEDDRFFMRLALQQSSKLTIIGEACNGEEAIAYLRGEDGFGDREKHPFPEVLVIDLKMPGKTGHDVLQWLQTQSFAKLIIVVISGSFLPEDIAQSYALGATAYHKKSVLKKELEIMVRDIERLVENL